MNASINYVLIEEFVTGTALDDYLKAALFEGQETALLQHLAKLAAFLAMLHSRSQTNQQVDPGAGPTYLTLMLNSLSQDGVIDAAQHKHLEELRDTWIMQGLLDGAPCVLVHGDVTPVNIVFGENDEVIAIDLERLHEADAARDVGMALAELRHAYLRTTHTSAAAEPFATHFLDTYLRERALNDQEAADFRTRCQFYTGTMMLRISRNDWLDMDYRQQLAAEGEQWLIPTLSKRIIFDLYNTLIDIWSESRILRSGTIWRVSYVIRDLAPTRTACSRRSLRTFACSSVKVTNNGQRWIWSARFAPCWKSWAFPAQSNFIFM